MPRAMNARRHSHVTRSSLRRFCPCPCCWLSRPCSRESGAAQNTLAKPAHQAPILVADPVNPPTPLPRYRYRSPLLLIASTSALPSPVKSPTENTLVNPPHATPILVADPVNPPTPLPLYRYRSPLLLIASTSALPSPVKSPTENTWVNPPHATPILVADPVNPPTPLPRYRYRSPLLLIASTSALPSPVKSTGFSGVTAARGAEADEVPIA